MKAVYISAIAAVSPVLAGFDTWSPPGPYDGTTNDEPIAMTTHAVEQHANQRVHMQCELLALC